jgi:PAS domain-containing protein
MRTNFEIRVQSSRISETDTNRKVNECHRSPRGRGSTPEPAQTAIVLTDPTPERKFADDALRDSEARYRRLFETAQDGILILDAHTRLIIDVNFFLICLLDYPREDFPGKTLWDIGPFKQIQVSKAAFLRRRGEG